MLIIVGSIGPWANALFITVDGLRGDGRLTIAAGIIAALLLYGYVRGTQAGSGRLIFAIIMGAVAALIGIVDASDIASRTANIFGRNVQIVSIEWGLYAVIVGGVGLVISGLIYSSSLPSRSSPTVPPPPPG